MSVVTRSKKRTLAGTDVKPDESRKDTTGILTDITEEKVIMNRNKVKSKSVQDESKKVCEPVYGREPLKEAGKSDTTGQGELADPQHVVEYRREVQAYLGSLEKRPELRVTRDFLAGQSEVLPTMRALLVDWMVATALELALLAETLQLSVQLLDRFLEAELPAVTKDKLQLIAATALLVAAKYEETYPPEISELSHFAAGAAPGAEILKMELRMLASLGFHLGAPLPLQFLRWGRLADPGLVGTDTHCLAKYITELSLVDYTLVRVTASTRAAAALALAIRLLGTSSIQTVWKVKLQQSTGCSLPELGRVLRQMARLLGVAATNPTLLTVYRKYSSATLCKIARISVLAGPLVAQLAKGEGL